MSIFGKIMSAIFGSKAAATPAGAGTAAGGGTAAGAGSAAAPSSAPAAPAQSVDVAAIVDKAAAAKGEKLEWRTSIVDLMKALDIDFELRGAQGTGEGTRLHRRQQRFRQHEHLAAQAGDGETGRERRQAAARDQALTSRRRRTAIEARVRAGLFNCNGVGRSALCPVRGRIPGHCSQFAAVKTDVAQGTVVQPGDTGQLRAIAKIAADGFEKERDQHAEVPPGAMRI